MAESKNTKQVLAGSMISIILCCVMFLGTTYAWFQETVTANINITAETVSAALLDAEGNLLAGQGNTATLSSGTTDGPSIVFYEVLTTESSTEPERQSITILSTEPATVWDLGKIYQTAPMTLVNTGSLKLKYTISVEGIEEALKEAFVFMISVDGISQAIPYTGELSMGESDAAVSFAVQVYLNPDNASIAAGASLDNMVINIIAEQAE